MGAPQKKKKPAQQLFSDLLYGPKISTEDPESLFFFAHNCMMATQLQATQRGTLAALEEDAYQDTITARLDSWLRQKWYEHRQARLLYEDSIKF